MYGNPSFDQRDVLLNEVSLKLPRDLPHWKSNEQKKYLLLHIHKTFSPDKVINNLQSLYSVCCAGLNVTSEFVK